MAVQSLARGDLEARRELEDATRLAAKGRYRCRVCRKEGPQQQGLLVTYGGNVLLAICPACVAAPITISRDGSAISVELQRGKPQLIVGATSMQEVPQHLANPRVEVKKL